MLELWVKVTGGTGLLFAGYGTRQWESLYEITFFCDAEYAPCFLESRYSEARILVSGLTGGALKYHDNRLLAIARDPVFVKLDYVDPRECQALPIGPLVLIGLQKKSELDLNEERGAVLPRGPLREAVECE